MMSGNSLEIIDLQERVDAMEKELAEGTKRLKDLSLECQRIKPAQAEADKELKHETLLYNRAVRREMSSRGV